MERKKITIGITAHVDAGKTTLSEAMLYLTGELREQGRVDHGSSFLDDDPIEKERGITIFSRQARFQTGKADVTLIDTPGHVDFSAETERSLWVLDYALLVISGSEGVQAHTKTLVRMLKERGIPVFVFVNKMDIAIKSREELTGAIAAELDLPAVDFGGAAQRTEKFVDDVTLNSAQLSEAVLDNMLFAESNAETSGSRSHHSSTDGTNDGTKTDGDQEDSSHVLSDEQIAQAVADHELVPVMFGSALKTEGVRELIEVIERYTKEPDHKKAFGAKVYKTMTDKDGERLSFIKITGGSLKVRDSVVIKSAVKKDAGCGDDEDRERDAAGKSDERNSRKINQIRLYSGSRFKTADYAGAGTVCAVTGLGSILAGTALGEEEPEKDHSAEPFMVYSVCVPDDRDIHSVMDDMQQLTAEDPALAAAWSADGDEILIRIMGEVQLEVLRRMIKERFGYEVGFGQGRVLYRETITETYEGVGHFEPLRHYAEVHLIVSPAERGSGIVITSDVPEDKLALNWQRLIWTHLEEKAHTGVLTGAPLTDLKISIAAGKAHLKHTMGGDFREATYRAVRNAMMQAKRDGNVMLLEPWCEYEIELPAKDLGRAATDIKQMGGTQESLEQREGFAVIKGRVPSVKIEPYRQILTGYTSGEGKMFLTQCGYDAAVDAGTVIEEIGYDAERDTANSADSVFVNHSGSDIVKWDEVTEHMHLPAVLKRENGVGTGTGYGSGQAAGGTLRTRGAGSTGGADAREEERRRIAAEKDLQRIFEMTYGRAKPKRYTESKTMTAAEDISDEEAAFRDARNAEIKAQHAAKRDRSSGQKDSGLKGFDARSFGGENEKGALLLIDGYNLIFADEELKKLSDTDVGSARDSLTERLVNYAGYTGVEVKVVFDAYKVVPGEGSAEKHLGVEVIYTAAGELADVRIGKMAAAAKGRRVYVVSSDQLIQQDVWMKGAMRISSREFIRTLIKTEEEIRDLL